LELIVLGSSGSWPLPGGATSGYLLTHEGFNLWIDMGTGTLARLQKYLPHEQVDGALISHGHPDHYVDLYMLFYARSFYPEALPSMPLFMPSGCFDRIASAVSEQTAAAMRETFDLREINPGASFDIGPFRVDTRPMRHTVPTLGLRLQAGSRVLAYTADTAPTEEIRAIARESDVLLAEATYLEVDPRAPLHLSAGQAGEVAAEAGARQLILTHLWPTVDPEATRAQAMEAFGDAVTVATEGLRLDIDGPERDR
jgi:ribonuclease BN (tRNA processing enzyme)